MMMTANNKTEKAEQNLELVIRGFFCDSCSIPSLRDEINYHLYEIPKNSKLPFPHERMIGKVRAVSVGGYFVLINNIISSEGYVFKLVNKRKPGEAAFLLYKEARRFAEAIAKKKNLNSVREVFDSYIKSWLKPKEGYNSNTKISKNFK